MSGLYIHIPYCKQKCIYCDFYSSATRESKESYIKALTKEISLRKDYLDKPLRTIFFGGGTPSTLSKEEIILIFKAIKNNFDLSLLEEITFEANPEHLNKDYLDFLISTPINRLSLGTQSFDDVDLKTLGRKHSSLESIEVIKNAQRIGFDNISIDLMFNLPSMSLDKWKTNLFKAMELNIQHISAYSLSVEEGTMLDKLITKKRLSIPSETEQLEQFNYAIDFLESNGFEHYETSNYAAKGFRSLHNSNYWNNTHYLGVGASAHSFDGKERRWNISSIDNYSSILNSNSNEDYFEKEILSEKDLYNEYIMVGIRTKEGLDKNFIERNFSKTFSTEFNKTIESLLNRNLVEKSSQNIFTLTRKAIEISNQIALELIV